MSTKKCVNKMSELKTKDAAAIYYSAIGKTNYYVEDIIPQGLNILSGASKAGKSWLVLWLCLKISNSLLIFP